MTSDSNEMEQKILTSTSTILHRLEGYIQATQDLSTFRYADLYATVGMRPSYFNLIDTFFTSAARTPRRNAGTGIRQ